MLFNSAQFLIFFPVVFFVLLIIPRRLRSVWLLAASYYFYMCWNAKYAVLIAASTGITWLGGILLRKEERTGRRKLILAAAIVSNLLILFFFKYFNFLADNINSLLSGLGSDSRLRTLNLLLPVGISFYTFQALGYIIDVYRRDIEAEPNIINYALFVSFFPQLVAGPIERSGSLLRQVRELGTRKIWNYDRVVSGVIMMLWGLVIKMVIADRIAVFVDNVFGNIYACGSVELALGVIAFAIQIYCDFSGYSTIAIGAARVMGFDLMENFDAPYLALSVGDFWRRWHISLSTWFRDYVYIPLGGSRKGKVRACINIMITMAVSGLWHGAAWTFVVWGLIHGMYQVAGRLLQPVRKALCKALKVNTEAQSFRLGQRAVTFLFVCLAWIFFRADSMNDAILYFTRLFTRWNPWVLTEGTLYGALSFSELNILFAGLAALFAADIMKYIKKKSVADYLMEQNLLFRWAVLLIMIVCIVLFGQYGIDFNSAQFIYFNF